MFVFLYTLYVYIFKEILSKESHVFFIVILEHSRIYICCSTIQNICCSSNVPLSSCESSSSGSARVLQGCVRCNHADMEVRACGVSKWLLGSTLQVLTCPGDISSIAKMSVLWGEHGWRPLLSPLLHGGAGTESLRLDL